MKSLDIIEREKEERRQARAAQDAADLVDVLNQVVPGAAQVVEGQTFTRAQVEEIIRIRLAMERGEDPAHKLQRDEMWLKFREHLNEHGLPAWEFVEVFQRLDLNTLEGLKDGVNDVIWLTEEIPEYARQLEVQKAARAAMPKSRDKDILRQVFELVD